MLMMFQLLPLSGRLVLGLRLGNADVLRNTSRGSHETHNEATFFGLLSEQLLLSDAKARRELKTRQTFVLLKLV